MTENWGDVFQELSKRGGLFSNDADLASGLELTSVFSSTFLF